MIYSCEWTAILKAIFIGLTSKSKISSKARLTGFTFAIFVNPNHSIQEG